MYLDYNIDIKKKATQNESLFLLFKPYNYLISF